MQTGHPLNVRISDLLKVALDDIVESRRQKSPLMPPTISDVIRQLIADEYTRLNQDNHRCEHCHQDIPAGEEETTNA